MKVAVCVSGIPKINNSLGSLQKYNAKLKSKFPMADFYYATWEGYKSVFEQEFPEEHAVYFKEPTIEYHPYFDLAVSDHASWYVAETFEWIKKGGEERKNWSSHHIKQILIHKNLIASLPKEYDVIVRARYDSVISDKADFIPFIESTYNSGVTNGFAVTKRELFDNMYQSDLIAHPRMKVWLLDQLIIHRRDRINNFEIDQLYQARKLNPAEHGWFQILSKPYLAGHINNHGWVNHDKNVDNIFIK